MLQNKNFHKTKKCLKYKNLINKKNNKIKNYNLNKEINKLNKINKEFNFPLKINKNNLNLIELKLLENIKTLKNITNIIGNDLQVKVINFIFIYLFI